MKTTDVFVIATTVFVSVKRLKIDFHHHHLLAEWPWTSEMEIIVLNFIIPWMYKEHKAILVFNLLFYGRTYIVNIVSTLNSLKMIIDSNML